MVAITSSTKSVSVMPMTSFIAPTEPQSMQRRLHFTNSDLSKCCDHTRTDFSQRLRTRVIHTKVAMASHTHTHTLVYTHSIHKTHGRIKRKRKGRNVDRCSSLMVNDSQQCPTLFNLAQSLVFKRFNWKSIIKYHSGRYRNGEQSFENICITVFKIH